MTPVPHRTEGSTPPFPLPVPLVTAPSLPNRAAPGAPATARSSSPATVVRATTEIEAEILATTARLEELERLQALVVSTTAHELRTPLTVLRVHADVLRTAGGHLGADERRSLDAIAGAVDRLQDGSDRLVSDLRAGAGGAEEALRRWLGDEDGATRVRPATAG